MPPTLPYARIAIAYFSGTGNSRRVAQWMPEHFPGANVQIASMCSRQPVTPDLPPDLAGFIFPTHGFTAPWAAIRFLLHLKPGARTPAFVIATRAGTRPGRFFLPGLAGTSCTLAAVILLLKGYRVRGFTGLDMPSNWTALHWGISTENSHAIIRRAHERIAHVMTRIAAGQTFFLSLGNILEFLFGIALLPVSLAYLLVGRFGLAKLFYANETCTGCGLCARQCPVGAIKMKGKTRPLPYWTFSCESCMRCMNFCPHKSVEASHPLAILFCFAASMSVSLLLYGLLAPHFPSAAVLLNPFLANTINYPYAIACIFVLYILFHLLMRFRPLNWLFTRLTLTHYFRRYHEPSTSPRDIHQDRDSAEN